ncbi:MAG: polynucleotide adenylyltransferase, partial [Lachnospiraceae bacterium]|nr:polynucleotide adenylyltransferase [Lachnospiraceae bacterium]
IGPERFLLLNVLQRADSYGKKPEALEHNLARCDRVMAMYEEILARRDCFRAADLAVKGADLIAAGMAPGPEMGKILAKMLDDVMREPAHNEKGYLMRIYT